MDFSSAGYMGGGVALPNAATVKTLNPSGGDDTANLQSAINYVGGLTADTNGIRGALQLGTGTFLVSGQINITASGVVVRGSGSGAGGTIIQVTASSPITLFNIAGSGSPSTSRTVNITNSYVPSGATTFGVSSTSGYSVGNTVIIGRTVTTNWINYVGMNPSNLGGDTWIAAGTVITTDRIITGISGNQITLDAPLTDSFDTNYLGIPAGTMSKYSWSGRISQVGLEHLFIQEPAVTTAYQSVYMDSLMDSWVRDVVIQDGASCFKTDSGAKRITVDSVIIQHTVAINAAAPAADFDCYGTQLFFNNCEAFGIIANGITNRMWPFLTQQECTGPFVLLNFYTTEIVGITPHQRWTTGVLADNCSLPDTADGENNFLGEQGINYCNRGTSGTGQGWATGWSVAWNDISPYFLVSEAPGSKNWCIGGIGTKTTDSPNPDGIYDTFGSIVSPHSLYLEQLKERLGGAAVENIGYQLFTISNSPSSQTIPAGTNTTFSVTVGDPTLMSNIVALSVSGLPANMGASLNTNFVTGAGSATLTVTTSNSIATGTYTLNVIGASAGVSHTNTVSLVVEGFSLSASPTSQTILVGDNANYIVTLTTSNSFNGSVNFGLSGLPPEAGASFNPASLSANGNSALSLTTASNTPPGNYTLTINGTNGASISSTTITLTISTLAANPGTLVWTNGAADINWSSVLNWTNITSGGNGPPGIFNDVVFTNFSTAVTGTTINNVVDSGFAGTGGTIASLSYSDTTTGTFQNTLIANGVTLNVTGTGGLTVGSSTAVGSDAAVVNTISGAGGALVVNNASASMNVFLGITTGTITTDTLNMTNLGTFSFTGARLLVGVGVTAPARASGSLFLARTNTIALSGTSPQMDIGENTGNGSSVPSTLYLGQTNVINADSIAVGIGKQVGSTIQFNPSFTNNNPVAYFRGANGVSPVATWAIGDGLTVTGSAPKPAGANDFSGGTVDIVATAMWLGKSSSGAWTGGATTTGTLTLTAGNISVGNLTNAMLAVSDSSQTSTGTINVNGTGRLSVGNFVIANTNGFTGTANGTLNIINGTVAVGTLTAGTGTSTVNLNSGTLIITNTAGTSAAKLTALNLTGGSLHLNVNGTANVTNIVATTVTTSGTTTIAIDSIVNVSGTVQIPLISYTGIDPYGALSLGTLPAGYTGYLFDNADNSSVDLSITSSVKPTPQFTGISLSGTTLNISATNGADSGQYMLLGTTNLAEPLNQWKPLLTNNFDGSGNLNLSTNIINPAVPQEFYILSNTNWNH
jgi:hypothetical protein